MPRKPTDFDLEPNWHLDFRDLASSARGSRGAGALPHQRLRRRAGLHPPDRGRLAAFHAAQRRRPAPLLGREDRHAPPGIRRTAIRAAGLHDRSGQDPGRLRPHLFPVCPLRVRPRHQPHAARPHDRRHDRVFRRNRHHPRQPRGIARAGQPRARPLHRDPAERCPDQVAVR